MKSIFAFLLLASFVLAASLSAAQTWTGADAAAHIKGAELVVRDDDRNSISFVRMSASSSVPVTQADSWLRTVYAVPPSTELRLAKQDNDALGFTHYRYRQYAFGIPVEWSTVIVHARDGRIVSTNAEYYGGINAETQPRLTGEQALEKASTRFQAPLRDGGSPRPELVILPVKDSYRLAWRCDLYSEKPLKRNYLYVDATDGRILLEVNRIHTADAAGTAVTRYNGTRPITADSLSPTSFRLRETGRGTGVNTYDLNNTTSYGTAVDFTDTDNFWNTTTNFDNAAYDAHFGSEATYDYYLNTYGRNSIDNAGFAINSYVHYSTGYVNAFWDGSRMTYGDGDGVTYFPLTSLDIVGHEITHGLTEHTAGLIYSGESGALNESFSDIFGITIDFYKNPSTANWLEGDQINVNGIPFRSMENPNLYGCPDTYGGLYWNAGDIVHYNSSVMNFWYYLLCNGGTGTNDIGNSFTVTGIGMTDAAAIAFRNLTVYLTPNSNFANARTFALQSALDLFGNCSSQLIQATNAWYAVGVGGVFSNSVVSAYTVGTSAYCTVPATVNFTNTSINATTYAWDFGDGGTSTLASPSHTYASAGTFTVTLIANGPAACASSDTTSGSISVTNGGGPVSAACSPATVSYCCGVGIQRLEAGTIVNVTGNASEGYRDFTCSHSTTVTAGDFLPVTVYTGGTTNENVAAFIDYDNDGQLNSTNEKVFVSNNQLYHHGGLIYTPVTATLNTPLRMRFLDDNASYAIPTSCTNPQDGQAEDYTIVFVPNTLPPIANFGVDDTVVSVGDTVRFYDLSQHAPTSWAWGFPGGTLTGSSARNPYTIYTATGTYAVRLTVSNAFGVDSLIRLTYITVVNAFNMCSSNTASASVSGYLYDSGGPTGSYANNENCSFLIQPSCADSITLTFSAFSTESCCDYLRVYNGSTTAAPLLAQVGGTTLHAPITATAGAMLVTFHSDGSVISSGFSLAWTTVQYSTLPPAAAFAVSDPNPPLGVPVHFTDMTTNLPQSWSWDFGDGFTSPLMNPDHAYTVAGTYTVRLIASTCNASDTVTHTVTVQAAPAYSVIPDSIVVSISCGDSITVPLRVANGGGGDLVVIRNSGGSGVRPEMLALQYGTDLSREYPNTLLSINQFFTDYNLSVVNTTLPSTLQAALAGKDIFLMTEPENGTPSVYSGFGPVLQNFVNSGGVAILCGASGTQASCILNTGLLSGAYVNDANGLQLTLANPSHPLLNGVVAPLTGTNGTYVLNITNADKIPVVQYAGNDVVTVRPYGSGWVVFIAFDYFDFTANTQHIVANAVQWARDQVHIDWLSTTPDTLEVTASDTGTVLVTLRSTGLYAGTYTYPLVLHTNDPLHPVDTIPVSMTIGGPALMTLGAACMDFDTLMEHTVRNDSVMVTNQGCDTLRITGLAGATGFTVLSVPPLFLPPHDTTWISVAFAPGSAGPFSGQLTVLNNDHDTTVCLTGVATEAPSLQLLPSSITDTLTSCNDSLVVPVRVINNGGTGLDVHFSHVASVDNLRVLAYTYGADLAQEYPNTLTALNQHFSNYTLTVSSTTTPSVLQGLLANKDVLLVPEPESATPSVYTTMGPVMQAFAASGGVVVFCGAGGTQGACLTNTGLFSGTSGPQATGFTLTVADPSHPIATGLAASFVGSNATFTQTLTNSDRTDIITYQTNSVLSVRPIGSGWAVFIAFDYFAYDVNASLALGNIFRWIQDGRIPAWLSVTPDSLSVPPGDTLTATVTLRNNGLANGTYVHAVQVRSNDPLHLTDSLTVTLVVAAPPCLDFTANSPDCHGEACFSDSLVSNATSVTWNFGDGTTSTLPAPCHTYGTSGTYAVTLSACNSVRCDSVTKTVVVPVIAAPLPAPCSPSTTSYCCGEGITRVQFNTINNTSANGSAGYEDFSCTQKTTVVEGQLYPLTVTTGLSFNENVRVWIDYNNDAQFTANELVLSTNNLLTTHAANVVIPVSAVHNQLLRMRVMSDYYQSPAPQPCVNVVYGQCEDYTVTVVVSAQPVAHFSYAANACTGLVQFSDQSQGSPATLSWDFGDGQISALPNPAHLYATTGTYTVTLVACNGGLCDTAVQVVQVAPLTPSLQVSGSLVAGQPIAFSSTTAGANYWLWNFGDGDQASSDTATHTYAAAGTYIVTLFVSNAAGCSGIAADTLVILPVNVNDLDLLSRLSLYPNPFREAAVLEYTLAKPASVTVRLLDVLGQEIQRLEDAPRRPAGDYRFPITVTAPGLYFIEMTVNGQQTLRKLVRTN